MIPAIKSGAIPPIAELRPCIEGVLRDAGQILKSMFGTEYAIQQKADGSLVTAADLASNTFIKGELNRYFPSIPVESEEDTYSKGASGTDLAWIVDPLDGTENFATHNTHFGIAVGLRAGGRVVAGGIGHPFAGLISSFGIGEGAQRNGQPFDAREAARSKESARVAFIPTRDTSTTKFAQATHAKLYNSCRRLVDNWAPALDWYGLAAGNLDAIVSFSDGPAFAEFDALVGLALFTEARRGAALIQSKSIGSRVMQIASTSPDLISDLLGELTDG